MKTSFKLYLIAVIILASSPTFTQDMGGMFKAGSKPESYQIGTAEEKHDGKPVYYLKSTKSPIDGFGTIMTVIKPEEYLGKRVKMTGYIKTEEIVEYAGMWMRVDGTRLNEVLAFDNMSARPINGTTGWQKYEIVLDVSDSGTAIAYGVLFSGTGQVWLSNLEFEFVSDDVPITGESEKTLLNGWQVGSKPELYEMGLWEEKYNGHNVYFLKSNGVPVGEVGTLMKNIDPGEYKDKRIRVSAFIKYENIEDWAGMWMRVDSYLQGKMLGFDNMYSRPIKGSGDWQKYEIVLDIPDYSAGIVYGLLITGNGEMWMTEPWFEVVGDDVPTSNMLTEEYYRSFDNLDIPPELENIPNGIEIGHNPQTVSAVYNEKDSMYYWFYKTSIKPVREDIEITEFGAYNWAGDHWVFSTVSGKPFEPKDFSEWYKCKNAKMKKGKEYSDEKNWNRLRELQSGKALWYYIGKNSKGELFKGTAIVNYLPELKK
jgi:hypothetical protein